MSGQQQQKAKQAATCAYNSKQYDRIRVLGKGSFGTAIVHRRLADHSLVVLKEIDLLRFKGERERCSAINEARIMSELSHQNIIKYHNAYTTDTKLIIEMEYASMGTLATYLSCQVDPLEEQEILVIFRQIVAGLNYLHSKSIIHLDLKMSNIFVTIDGLVKIGDFGIAQYMEGDHSTGAKLDQDSTSNRRQHHHHHHHHQQTSSHLGTLAYSSPERCLSQHTDFKSDIWSLGCILYELITSRPLFVGNSLPELLLSITRIQYQPIKRTITPTLRDIFEQMIARSPEARPNASDLLEATDQLLAQIKLMRHHRRNSSKRQTSHHNHHHHHHHQRVVDPSTEVALLAHGQQDDDLAQINYLHSLIYQVRLDSHHIQVERVNLPPTKRIREMVKGRSHYLVLTYDNIVYGWGSKSCGQLGACGLSSTTRLRSMRSSSVAAAQSSTSLAQPHRHRGDHHSLASSLASSTQTIATAGGSTRQLNVASANQNQSGGSNKQQQQQHHLSKQLVMSMLEESQPTSRPFIVNELNHRKIIQVAAGNNFSVFLSKTGIVMTCGDGSSGCLGRGDFRSCFTPCMVESLLNSDIVSIGCGPRHVVAVCGNGRAFAWGKNRHGRLGIGGGSLKPTQSQPFEMEQVESIQMSDLGARGEYILRPQTVLFPEEVFIKRVFCGDRSTIFIDRDNRCWACGENRFNKLGLDVRRRFKRPRFVNCSYQPSPVVQLNKYKILTCHIGKNHTTFLTSEGKLIVYGQDIDYSYRLRSNIISARDSHRRISFQLQTQRRLLHHLNNPPFPSACTSSGGISCGGNRRISSSRQSATSSKFRQKQIVSYMKKSRANKKMPFECVISVSCTPKFTLALTGDNRVYFWGTRSHLKEDSLPQATSGQPTKKSPEPQLVASQSDECFIKIAGTNNSLMSSIQILGSDQPMIHAQDPRLTAKSLADLWILDYKPTRPPFSSETSSSLDSQQSHSRLSDLVDSDNLSSTCSQCQSPQSADDTCSCCCSCIEDDDNQSEGEDDEDNSIKHDAILEPQPIVSLYVPSMFNHNGHSLNMVDLFCFDEDKFYLILDTTIKFQHPNGGYSRPSSIASTSFSGNQAYKSKRFSSSPVNIMNNNNNTAAQDNLNNDNQFIAGQQQVLNQRAISQDSMLQNGLEENRVEQQTLEPLPYRLTAVQESQINQINPLSGHEEESGGTLEKSTASSSGSSCCHDNNNNNDNTVISISKGGVSLYEPRSLSTFAASLSNHIIVGPTMRTMEALEQEQPFQPLLFDQDTPEESENLELNHVNHLKRRASRHSCENNSGSTTNIEETSSMPSWVRNEFIQCQEAGGGVFNIESSHGDGDQLSFNSNDVETIRTEGHGNMSSEEDDDDEDLMNIPTYVHNTVQNSPAESLYHLSALENGQERRFEQTQKARGLMTQANKGLISRSQPDVSDLEGVGCSLETTRRASIIDERQEADNSNLLKCDVYRSSNLDRHLSSNLNSTLSSPSNSNHALGTCQWPAEGVIANGGQTSIPPQTVSHQQQQVDSYFWLPRSRMEHDELAPRQHQQFRSGEDLNSTTRNAHKPLYSYRSTMNLSTSGKSKTGSSLSLTSLRRSLLKLFC